MNTETSTSPAPATARSDTQTGINDPRHYEAIIESSDDAIIGKTCAGIVTSWNRAAEHIFGWSANEIVGRHITMLFPPDRLEEEAQVMSRIAAGEKLSHFDTVRQRKDGRPVHVSITVSPIVDGSGEVVGVSKIARDITERIEAQKTIWRFANFDTVTQLPNRRLFLDRLGQALLNAQRDDSCVGVIFMDLNGFKAVNDSFGHAAGDELLKLVADRVSRCIRKQDTLARMGGDEFTILLPEVSGHRDAEAAIARVKAALTNPFAMAGGHRVPISSSFGYALSSEHGSTADELLRHADRLMYDAKRGHIEQRVAPDQGTSNVLEQSRSLQEAEG